MWYGTVTELPSGTRLDLPPLGIGSSERIFSSSICRALNSSVVPFVSASAAETRSYSGWAEVFEPSVPELTTRLPCSEPSDLA